VPAWSAGNTLVTVSGAGGAVVVDAPGDEGGDEAGSVVVGAWVARGLPTLPEARLAATKAPAVTITKVAPETRR
jgi:hypothetical protein